jgi:hypothetical protein
MKRFILTAALLGGFFAFSATETSAIVCARGYIVRGVSAPVVQSWDIAASIMGVSITEASIIGVSIVGIDGPISPKSAE